jgi:hypothetical protein
MDQTNYLFMNPEISKILYLSSIIDSGQNLFSTTTKDIFYFLIKFI